ncbi:MAG TPA: hypothetical protein VGS79_13785 [Puia sp.]|nr:hypothetical protein [Puia sp.]
MRNHRYISLTIFLILSGFCQPAWCQQENGDDIAAAFLRYQSRTMQEKLFVHIDKSFYLAGENCWLSIYDVDATTNSPLGLSAIASVELLDKELKPVVQQRVRLDSGRGSSSFHIPASLPSGRYLFRAYTSWMKNFSPDEYFSESLTILNTTTESPAQDSAQVRPPGAQASESGSPGGAPADGESIRFFPEGGNLVADLNSVIAFKATDRYGHGVACQGTIYDQQHDTLAHFTSNQFGMGRFQLTPKAGYTYSARVETPGGTVTETLPAAYPQGYTMHLDDSDPHRLTITVSSRTSASSPLVYLFVHAHRRVSSLQVARLDGNTATFTVDKDSLRDGISHFVVFDAHRTPMCERLWCKQPRGLLHIDLHSSGDNGPVNATGPAPATATSTGAAAYDTRRRVDIDLQTTDPAGDPIPASLSVSTILIDSVQAIPDETILSYLLLSSDLKGTIESPQYYFTNPDNRTAEALDNLMLTQGWSRFRWDDIRQNKKPYFEFLPETSGPVINAHISRRLTGAPPPPMAFYASIPGRQFQLATTLSHADGNLNFQLDNFYGNRELIVQAPVADSTYRIDVSSPFSDHYTALPAGEPLSYKDRPQTLLSRSIAVQAENAYLATEKYQLVPAPVPDTMGFYGTPTRHYNLDDFVRFVTLDEVIREYVEDVRVRWKSGNSFFRVRDALFNVFFDGDPLLLIDGVPVFDNNKLLNINPLKLAAIDVISHRYYLGPTNGQGLVSFRSYDGDLGGYPLDPNAVVVQFNGLEQLREFYSPVYTSVAHDQSTIPDLRNQLLWSPAISTGKDGKKRLSLYTSDLKGNYALIVQGMTSNGLLGYSTLRFTVR